MSAAKIREAAKQDGIAKKRACKKTAAAANGADHATLWKDAFDDDQPLSIGEAADDYASWVSSGRQGEDAKEATFVACKDYKYRVGGPGRCREGWVLKTGALGFGYYKDGVSEQRTLQLHKLLWPTRGVEPVVICLDEVVGNRKIIGDPIAATMEGQDDKEDTRKGGKTRKQKKDNSRVAKAKTAVEHVIEANTVMLTDTSHRDKGWWAIDTGNPNAWGGAAELLATSSADAMAIQETRVPEAATKDHEHVARGLGWNMAISGCGTGENGGDSSGVAVGCRKHIGLSESCEDDLLPDELKARFTAKHLGAMCKGGLHLCSGTCIPGSAFSTSSTSTGCKLLLEC